MKATQKTEITVKTTLSLPVSKVWEYWNTPEHITQWCQASSEWHAPYSENDLRVGGTFKTTMAAKDGSMSFDFEGVYDTVKPQEEITYTMGDGRKARILFTDQGKETLLVETFEAEDMNPLDMQQAGWQAILDNFKRYAEALK